MSAPNINPFKKKPETLSPLPPTSENLVPYLDKEVQAFLDIALQNPTPENVAMAHDLQLRYAEYLDDIITSRPAIEGKSITLTVKGVTVKFGNIDQVAEWMSGVNDG